MDSLKVLDPEGPIREADIGTPTAQVRFVPQPDVSLIWWYGRGAEISDQARRFLQLEGGP